MRLHHFLISPSLQVNLPGYYMQQHHLPIAIVVGVADRRYETAGNQNSKGRWRSSPATWRDLLAALGALAGTWLIFVRCLEILCLIATFALLATIIADGLNANRQFKNVFPWK